MKEPTRISHSRPARLTAVIALIFAALLDYGVFAARSGAPLASMALLATFAGLWFFAESWARRAVYDDRGITFHSPWSRPKFLSWSEIADYETSFHWFGYFHVFSTEDGDRFRLRLGMPGEAGVIEKTRETLKARNPERYAELMAPSQAVRIARAARDRIRQGMPDLDIVETPPPPPTVALFNPDDNAADLTIPQQNGSAFEVTLTHDDDADLTFCASDPALYPHPLFIMQAIGRDEPGLAPDFTDVLVGFLSGAWRLLVTRGEKNFKSELQQPFGGGWRTVATYRANGRLPPGEGDVWKLRNR